MVEARINEWCIIGLPTCGYAFSSSRMAFVATPADEEFALELEVINNLLAEKEYEGYIALQKLDPASSSLCFSVALRSEFIPIPPPVDVYEFLSFFSGRDGNCLIYRGSF
jgi:hypothetical protein